MARQPEPEVLEAAATWYVDLLDAAPGDDLHAAHRRWLMADPMHRQAWERVDKLQQVLGKTSASIARPVLSAGGQARRRAIKTLTGVLLLAGAGSVGWQRRDVVQALAANLQTNTGQRLDHLLADGSRVQLNTDTAVDVRYDTEQRQLILYRGELLISTAVDAASRPFIVQTRHGSVCALGTRFTVFSDPERCRVGVLEHAVEIRRSNIEVPTHVGAGQQMTFGANSVGTAGPLEPNATAWIDGLLVASDWRLDRFAAELSRYHAGHISCSPEVAGLRISGAFQVGDLQVVLGNVATALPIRIRHFTRYWTRFEAA